ncbi:RNA polymerase sigma-70 factor (ECF subfamily) [Allocatelliglobosispora scoriae]|uniref:RNA polymerase sigma-70 factor (ECF subfamily) n=1 Tax=Allocatelliglobosispora scoriae TaxID=643052 RepID=A0A841BWU4_9ACTN|nr:sigma-70 family RNA polymerase sigma factor [Allocatelliglobosispora scoriae]MBB5871200.1 RNA polymerase sigma-70 factor (ECF subfamily) [Allocatelliglobosispora scoriae]
MTAQRVDLADLGEVFDAYSRPLLRYATQRVGPNLAEDVVAETFLIAHERRQSYDPAKGEPLPWLYGIATNVLRKHLRVEKRALRAIAGQVEAENLDQRAADRIDAERSMRRAASILAGLPRRQRDVLLLFAVAELEYAEIAAALGIPLGSVQSALHRARTKVRAAIVSGGSR